MKADEDFEGLRRFESCSRRSNTMTEETPIRSRELYGFPPAEKGMKYKRNVKDGYVTVQVNGYGQNTVKGEVVDEKNSITREGVEIEISEDHFDQYYEKITQ